MPRQRKRSSTHIALPAQIDDALTMAERIWQVVHAIPKGRVSTYGEVAAVAGLPKRARLVGHVLGQLPGGSRLPWHRVVGAGGRIVIRGGGEIEQAQRLRSDGIIVKNGRIDLRQFGWQNTTREPR